MLKLGEIQKLIVSKEMGFGDYLKSSDGEPDEVLLPRKMIPEGTKIGDELEVFLYKDSEDRIIATTKTPFIKLGETKVLSVINSSRIGAFLDWGLEKDLFLPFRQQTRSVKKGDEVLVYLYIDHSDRLCASMRVYDRLIKEAPYKAGDMVDGFVYEHSEKFGLFVAVDEKYSARIPAREDLGNVKVGDHIHARVTRVLDDGRVDLSVQEKSYLQMDADAAVIMEELEKRGGSLGFSDKADPELIKDELHMSKAAFKRACGRLLKNGKIMISEDNIRIKN